MSTVTRKRIARAWHRTIIVVAVIVLVVGLSIAFVTGPRELIGGVLSIVSGIALGTVARQ